MCLVSISKVHPLNCKTLSTTTYSYIPSGLSQLPPSPAFPMLHVVTLFAFGNFGGAFPPIDAEILAFSFGVIKMLLMASQY